MTQHVHRIVTDGKYGNLVARKVRQAPLQLDELRLAKGSPAGATVKHHQCWSPVSSLMQRYHRAVLVWQHHVREAFSYSRTNLAEVDAKIRHHSHTFSFSPVYRADCESIAADRSPIGYVGGA
jgi:hypothetical protein